MIQPKHPLSAYNIYFHILRRRILNVVPPKDRVDVVVEDGVSSSSSSPPTRQRRRRHGINSSIMDTRIDPTPNVRITKEDLAYYLDAPVSTTTTSTTTTLHGGPSVHTNPNNLPSHPPPSGTETRLLSSSSSSQPQQQYVHYGFGSLGRYIGQQWRNLDPASRLILQERAALYQNEYYVAVAEWKKKNTNNNNAALIQSDTNAIIVVPSPVKELSQQQQQGVLVQDPTDPTIVVPNEIAAIVGKRKRVRDPSVRKKPSRHPSRATRGTKQAVEIQNCVASAITIQKCAVPRDPCRQNIVVLPSSHPPNETETPYQELRTMSKEEATSLLDQHQPDDRVIMNRANHKERPKKIRLVTPEPIIKDICDTVTNGNKGCGTIDDRVWYSPSEQSIVNTGRTTPIGHFYPVVEPTTLEDVQPCEEQNLASNSPPIPPHLYHMISRLTTEVNRLSDRITSLTSTPHPPSTAITVTPNVQPSKTTTTNVLLPLSTRHPMPNATMHRDNNDMCNTIATTNGSITGSIDHGKNPFQSPVRTGATATVHPSSWTSPFHNNDPLLRSASLYKNNAHQATSTPTAASVAAATTGTNMFTMAPATRSNSIEPTNAYCPPWLHENQYCPSSVMDDVSMIPVSPSLLLAPHPYQNGHTVVPSYIKISQKSPSNHNVPNTITLQSDSNNRSTTKKQNSTLGTTISCFSTANDETTCMSGWEDQLHHRHPSTGRTDDSARIQHQQQQGHDSTQGEHIPQRPKPEQWCNHDQEKLFSLATVFAAPAQPELQWNPNNNDHHRNSNSKNDTEFDSIADFLNSKCQ
jgi:hypothetical protein